MGRQASSEPKGSLVRWRLSGLAAVLFLVGCSRPPGVSTGATAAPPAGPVAQPIGGGPPSPHAAFLDTLAQRTFRFFWERSDAHTGLTPDRWPTRSFASVSATGFALTAYPIGVERGTAWM